MAKQNINSKKGFTIIEVVLVLAIAGLIFLMVFVALPTLQRSQRDTQRRQDMARVATAIINFQTNNNRIPKDDADASALLSTYLKAGGQDFKDPSGVDYSIYICKQGASGCSAGAINDYASGSSANPGKIQIVTNAKCGSEAAVASSGSSDFAILYKLEGAGTSCTDNQ